MVMVTTPSDPPIRFAVKSPMSGSPFLTSQISLEVPIRITAAIPAILEVRLF